MTPEADLTTTWPSFTSVTVTGTDVTRVVMTAVPFMPGVNSRTDNGLPLTVKRKSSGTVSSLVPSGQPDDQLVALDADYFKGLGFRLGRGLRQRHCR